MVKEMEHGNGLGERRKARRICYPQIKRKCDAIRSSKFEIKKLEAVGEEPLKINDSHVEYYTMPYGKVCPSRVGRHLNPGTRGPQSESGPYPGGASFGRLR